MELVSGWSDNEYVYLVERPADSADVRIRRMRAKWSAFFAGLDDADKLTLQRMREVVGLCVAGNYTRVDFKNRWARRDLVERLSAKQAAILEADVNPLRRFMSDHGNVNVSSSPKLGWIDLETDSRCSFYQATELGQARILCWALVDEHANLIAKGLLEQDTDAAEQKLIEDLLVACKPYDVIMAWSGTGFDFPVLEKRAAAVGARPGGKHPTWARWCFLDCLEVFKKYHAHVHESGEEKTSYKLNSIANALLGEGKKEFQASRTWEAWAAGGQERAELLDYNIQDTLLMPKIEAKTGYVALHIAVCAVTRCFPDNRSLMAGQQGDGFLLRLGDIHGHRWPTKQYLDNAVVEKYAGAYVMEPTRTGIIDNVHVADFASLYPSIIRSWNISPETLLTAEQPDPSQGSCAVPWTDKIRFSKAQRGMFPRALDELVSRRAEYSRKQDAAEPGSPDWERYKRLNGAYKIVANSFYGIMGSPYARFFSAAAAEAVTQTGAHLIKLVGARSEQSGLDAFYGDTDSVFVSGESDSFKSVVSGLNEEWESMLSAFGCAESHIKLEFEKSFKRIVLVSAKRYIGRFAVYKGKSVSGTKIEVKGLEYKRGDTMRLTRDMQKELIDLLLGDDVPTLERVQAFVTRWKRRVLQGELTVDEIVMSQSVKGLSEYAERYTSKKCTAGTAKKKCGYEYLSTAAGPDLEMCPRCGQQRKRASHPPHVRVARLLAQRGEEIRAGTRIEYLVVSDEGQSIEAVPARDPGALEKISRDYYWTARIYPPTARLLESAFPASDWSETKEERKARRKAAADKRTRGVISDTALFRQVQNYGRVRTKPSAPTT